MHIVEIEYFSNVIKYKQTQIFIVVGAVVVNTHTMYIFAVELGLICWLAKDIKF